MEEREAIASLLMDHIKDNDIQQVEQCLGPVTRNQGHKPTNAQWRDVIRYEFSIQALMEYTLRYDVIAPRLLAYDILSLSPFLYAALKGQDNILINLIDHDIPVDMSIASGTTALHLAAFAGKVSTIKLLVEVYKADVNKQDKYGWSALHYASSEGHMDAAQALVDCGINVNLRDKDGTTAAFRSEINGYSDIVCFLCQLGEEDELLNVDPAYEGRPPLDPHEGIYSTVDKTRKSAEKTKTNDEKPEVDDTPKSLDIFRKNKIKTDNRPVSEIMMAAGRPFDSLPGRIKVDPKMTIRRLIRQQFQEALRENGGFGSDQDEDSKSDPDYERPIDVRRRSDAEKEASLASGAVGMDTLKGIVREEALNFVRKSSRSGSTLPRTQDKLSQQVAPPSVTTGTKSMTLPNGKGRNDYEDIYETVRHLKNVPKLPGVKQTDSGEDVPAAPPPLPPRNADMMLMFPGDSATGGSPLPGERGSPSVTLNLERNESLNLGHNAALKAAFQRICPKLGLSWRRLAHALPIESTPAKVDERIASIERLHPGNFEKQAMCALVEWRINHGFKKGTDDLIIALRKCQMYPEIEDVEKAGQEFTA